jgi:hypothetical protein
MSVANDLSSMLYDHSFQETHAGACNQINNNSERLPRFADEANKVKK